MDDFLQLDIRIDINGIWFYGTQEIFRKDIVQLFYQNLKIDSHGRYILEIGDEKCLVNVEDVAFVVKTTYKGLDKYSNKEAFYIHLSDGTIEELNLRSIVVGKDNVIYCTIKNGKFKARFSRPAYYQLAQYIEHNHRNDSFFIHLNGEMYYINKLHEAEN